MANEDEGPPAWIENFAQLDEYISKCEYCNGIGYTEVIGIEGYYKDREGIINCPDCSGTGVAS